ncbi:MAG TPA: hypothetical protein VHW24_19230 [Bryobacteraceae bacterium]|nr:hypothetical protein [Bryobacteraceae bacterium]
MRINGAIALVILAGTPVWAHRLDEYLQNTIVSIEEDRVQAEMILTPGVAVFPKLISEIDTDGNGVISREEQQAYAQRVLNDLFLAIDGHRLNPLLVSMQFPPIEEMKEGRGEIELDFMSDLPRGERNRRLTLENHHERAIAAYLVNCLVPRDPAIRIAAQHRNYTQSAYELQYEDSGVAPATSSLSFWVGGLRWLLAGAVLVAASLVFRRRRRRDPVSAAGAW